MTTTDAATPPGGDPSPTLALAPKLSVLMLTRNHEMYVARALGSVLEQQCDFPFEIVIGDDNSSDSTVSKIETALADCEVPARILRSTSQLGVCSNFERTFRACKGDHVAILEGDDYWSDSQKLLLTSRILDEEPLVVLVGHRAHSLSPDGLLLQAWPEEGSEAFSVETALERTLFRSCSMVFRRSLVLSFSPPFWKIYPPDRALQILLSQAGRSSFINRTMGVYRVHPGGVWSGLSVIDRATTNYQFFVDLKPLVQRRLRPIVDRKIYAQARALSRALRAGGATVLSILVALKLGMNVALWINRPGPLFRLFLDLVRPPAEAWPTSPAD